MILTLETRWFDDTPLPADLYEWFETLGSVDPSHWTDFYLPTSDPALNLKYREGKVQVKHRLAPPIRRSFGPHVTGHCEQWIKWSFPSADGSPHLREIDDTGLWLPVRKTRQRHRFTGDDQQSLSEALPTSPPAAIEIELTEISVDEETAWSLCIEAEGPAESLLDTLTGAGSALFTETFPISLSAQQSFGYVQWLQQLPPEIGHPPPEVLISSD